MKKILQLLFIKNLIFTFNVLFAVDSIKLKTNKHNLDVILLNNLKSDNKKNDFYNQYTYVDSMKKVFNNIPEMTLEEFKKKYPLVLQSAFYDEGTYYDIESLSYNDITFLYFDKDKKVIVSELGGLFKLSRGGEYLKKKNFFVIQNIATRMDYRKCGHMNSILSLAQEFLFSRSISYLMLDNLSGIKELYTSKGFQVVLDREYMYVDDYQKNQDTIQTVILNSFTRLNAF
jgi:hypothetical protein